MIFISIVKYRYKETDLIWFNNDPICQTNELHQII